MRVGARTALQSEKLQQTGGLEGKGRWVENRLPLQVGLLGRGGVRGRRENEQVWYEEGAPRGGQGHPGRTLPHFSIPVRLPVGGGMRIAGL